MRRPTLEATSQMYCGGEEYFELVVFSSYEIEEGTPYRGEMSARIGGATCKRLDYTTVEVLVGEKV